MYTQQIERIQSKLHQLREADSEFSLFGSQTHKYQMAPVWSTEEVARFEEAWKIKLPEEYKAFLLHVGSGGAGPYYGLVRPDDGVYIDLDYPSELNNVSGEFPYTEAWNFERSWDEDSLGEEDWAEQERFYFSTDKSAGLLAISNFGCGITINLVVNGQSYGEIWVDDRSNDNGIYPDHYFENEKRLTFLDWYETWLDRSMEELEEEEM
ncbi:SMI1/KNR4 family protein [Paenibacillus sp. CAA11]|uniref:SMI1/KNR4 family protein n=1 Tax=Paenibacillus sp. CAA11 TaxID=1532905 RepID=UPI000D379274|nr:SMI1/KNR4 family protein [Paenibacillus sp. CAA11]AWB43752.1 SMI1/KNR4 family protein [Paenibacillus sp. CAA11]